jgi:hypothetical protein
MKRFGPVEWWLVLFIAALALIGLLLSVAPRRVRAAEWPCGLGDGEAAATGALGAELYLDWRQTHQLAGTTFQIPEVNPWLGAHPGAEAIDRYFVLYAVADAALVCVLRPPARDWVLAYLLGVEVGSVQRNWALGARVGF